CLRNGIREKLILAPKVLVKAAYSQARCLHHARDASTTQPFGAELARGVPHDTIASSRFVFRFVTHISFPLDYISNPWTQKCLSPCTSLAKTPRLGTPGEYGFNLIL